MSTKTITIMEDAYKLLSVRKYKNESFSDVIRRMVREKKDIMRFAGAWKNVSDNEIKDMKKTIADVRRKSTVELLKKLDKNDLPWY